MADEAKQYPASERKLARLWQAGSTPASPALAAVCALASGGALAALVGPHAATWMRGWVETGLLDAGRPEHALRAARALGLQGAAMAAAVGLVVLVAVLVVQLAQRGSRPGGPPVAPASTDGPAPPRAEPWRGARALLLVALAGLGVTAAVRGVLMGIADVFDPMRPLGTMMTLAASVGWPLLIMLVGVAVLDAVAGRIAWLRGAAMTRREVEEELRETEGHPLTRERRGTAARGRDRG